MSRSFTQLVVTLDTTVQRLSTVFGQDYALLSLSLQPGAGNANPVFVGDQNVAAAAYGVRLEAASAGVPPAPWQPQESLNKKVKLSDIYVKGSNGEKLHVSFIPSI